MRPDRFWMKVTKTPTCWLWTGADNGHGYGKVLIAGKTVQAHRYAYVMLVGPIPEGLQLDHLCRVRNCVNPAHLEPVTALVNVRRAAAVKTECPNGHPYNEATTYVTTRGVRQCRECHRINAATQRAKKPKPDRPDPICADCSKVFPRPDRRGMPPTRCPECAAEARREQSRRSAAKRYQKHLNPAEAERRGFYRRGHGGAA